MSRSATFLMIALVSSVATPLVVRAAGSAAPTATASAPAQVATASVQTAAASVASASCTRRVRVVYQGLGPAPDACVTPR